MGVYGDLYDFAAKAGALEGYVYPKEKVDPSYLPLWVEHIVQGYRGLPEEVRSEFQESCNDTIGRAVQALIPLLGEDHEVIGKLKSLVTSDLPSSPNDFKRKE